MGKLLSSGGFGAVYLAHRKQDNAHLALKVMLSQVAVDPGARARFSHEIALLQGLRHAHIVPLFEQGAASGAFYFIMEYCEGGSVADLIERRGGKLALAEAHHPAGPGRPGLCP